MRRTLIVLAALTLAACAQNPPSAQEIVDKKMEPLPGKAVVYVVQNPLRGYGAGLTFDDGMRITTWPGTFYRWETTPGTHMIKSREANLSASIRLQVEAGRVYFVEHIVTGLRGSTTDATLQKVGDRSGRQLVANGRPCCYGR
jgi:hypothetical protein